MESWVLFALLSAIMAALATIFAKVGLQKVDSITATALRSVIMMLLAISIMIFARGFEAAKSLSQSEIIFIILSGIAGGLSWIFYFLALQKGEASLVSAIDRASLLFVLLFAIVFLHEELTLKKILSIALITIALYLIIL